MATVKDKAKRKAYYQEHYDNNKQYYMDRNKRVRKEKSEWLVAQKAKPCKDCGVQYPHYVMDFDHLDGSFKDKEVSVLVNYGWSRLKAEIEKCELVCSNCHRIRTYNRRIV